MYRITKDFTDIHYGHRVWTQKLRESLCAAGDTACACRHLHGHSGAASITVEAGELNDQGMVCDFKELGFMKDFLNTYFDHRFVVDINDPAFATITGIDPEMFDAISSPVVVHGVLLGHEFNMNCIDALSPQREVMEGFFVVNFIPTSESIVKYLYDFATAVLEPYGIRVVEAKWKETEKSEAVYAR